VQLKKDKTEKRNRYKLCSQTIRISISKIKVKDFNNGIHPGEPDGIDASMQFLRDLVIRQN
jgi:hypothetical protein